MLSSRWRSYLCLAEMYSSAGRSCLWLSKCHPLEGGHAKNCLNPIQYKEVPYLEVSKCYPVEGGHIYVLLSKDVELLCLAGRSCLWLSKCLPLQGGHAKNCLNTIQYKEVPYLEVSKCYPVEGGHIYVLLRCILVQGGRVYGCLMPSTARRSC